MQEKLHQGERRQSKGAKFVPVLDGNMKNAPKISAKYLEDKICKIKQLQNIPVILMTFLNEIKYF